MTFSEKINDLFAKSEWAQSRQLLEDRLRTDPVALMTDCLYSVAGCMCRIGNQEKASKFIRQHLDFRAMGAKSIYSLREARDRLEEILEKGDCSRNDVFKRELG